MSYYIILSFHLIAAIIFIGFLFADVVLFPTLNKLPNKAEAIIAIRARAVKIMPIMLLILILSGGYMLSYHLPISLLLGLKLFFVTLIVAGVLYSLSAKLFKFTPPPLFSKYFHLFALIMGFLTVICAKLMMVIG